VTIFAGAGWSEFVDQSFQGRVDLAELDHRDFAALEAAQSKQDKQRFVRGALVALLPDSNAVEYLENLGSCHRRHIAFLIC
jgi:hypothetical protein